LNEINLTRRTAGKSEAKGEARPHRHKFTRWTVRTAVTYTVKS